MTSGVGGADALTDRLAQDDDETAVQSALHRVFRHYIDAPPDDALAAAGGAAARQGDHHDGARPGSTGPLTGHG